MGDLAQQARELCEQFVGAIDALKGEVVEKRKDVKDEAARDELVAVQTSLLGLKSLAMQIRATVNAAHVCALVKEPPTLEERRRQVEMEEFHLRA